MHEIQVLRITTWENHVGISVVVDCRSEAVLDGCAASGGGNHGFCVGVLEKGRLMNSADDVVGPFEFQIGRAHV